MKKIFFFTLVLNFCIAATAQQQMAILSHNDSLSAFYGFNAFIDACSVAENGDIITLSSGTFNAESINKAITIRGNGFEEDTIAGTSPTILTKGSGNGNINLNIPFDSLYGLTLEGIRVTTNFDYSYLSAPKFTRCRFGKFSGGYETNMIDAVFTNCVIDEMNLYYGAPYATHRNTRFVNCVILSFTGRTPNNCKMYNCIAGLSNSDISAVREDGPTYTCTNCIFFSNSPSNANDNTSNCFNCIGINTGSDASLSYFSNTLHNNHNFFGFHSVFTFFEGQLNYGMYFDLLDTITSTITGNDGTEIGVYGGMVPFTSRVNSSRYVRCNVAPHTTLDGKLSVDIEVVSE